MKKITVYSKPGCPACVAAKNTLKAHGMGFTEIVIGEAITREQVIAMFPNQKTVPIIIVDGQQTDNSGLKMLIEG